MAADKCAQPEQAPPSCVGARVSEAERVSSGYGREGTGPEHLPDPSFVLALLGSVPLHRLGFVSTLLVMFLFIPVDNYRQSWV